MITDVGPKNYVHSDFCNTYSITGLFWSVNPNKTPVCFEIHDGTNNLIIIRGNKEDDSQKSYLVSSLGDDQYHLCFLCHYCASGYCFCCGDSFAFCFHHDHNYSFGFSYLDHSCSYSDSLSCFGYT